MKIKKQRQFTVGNKAQSIENFGLRCNSDYAEIVSAAAKEIQFSQLNNFGGWGFEPPPFS